MNVLIINGTPEKGWEEYDKALQAAAENLSDEHEVSMFTIRDMEINYCRGCFGCWVKTPGKCVFRDGMDDILSKYPNTDFLIFATPIKTGFMTSLTKKTMDRMIPVVLPYIELFENECHHPKRYDNNPVLGILVFDKGADADSVEITFKSIDRLSLNFHGKRTFRNLVGKENIMEVLENEISNY